MTFGTASADAPARRRRGGTRTATRLAVYLLLGTSCRATTGRPYYLPLPSAPQAEVELPIPQATRVLAETMARDSIALTIIRERDGYIDSGWLDGKTLEHTSARPLGTGVVRVRAWVGPSKEFWSELTLEATYRVMDDPSRPERELDAALPDDHPLQRRLAGVIRKLIEKYGNVEALKAVVPARPAPLPSREKSDSGKGKGGAKPDSVPAKPDTAKAKGDSMNVRPDTLKARRDTSSAAPGMGLAVGAEGHEPAGEARPRSGAKAVAGGGRRNPTCAAAPRNIIRSGLGGRAGRKCRPRDALARGRSGAVGRAHAAFDSCVSWLAAGSRGGRDQG